MSDQTVNLALPYILPSQAQKHVPHNEALQRLDVLTQLRVDQTLTAPPPAPDEAVCYAVGTGATDEWAGKDGQLAFLQDGLWIFLQPREGWRAWFAATGRLNIYEDGEWTPYDPIGIPPYFGINASADTANRLTVASGASLFNHAGNGHQMKINKASAADTASLLFQSGWSGRAEFGLTGSDDFEIKVSPDGSGWTTAMVIGGDGTVHLPARPLVRATLDGGVMTPATGTQTGFTTLSIAQGGFALGAAVPGGAGNRLVVPATGPYLIVLKVAADPAGSFAVAALANGTEPLATVDDNDAGTTAYSGTAIGLAVLEQGDWVSLLHTGSTPLDFSDGRTELSLIML